MTKHLLWLLILMGLLTSCDKSYKYVEVVQEKGILGGMNVKEKEGQIIKAKDDTTAYLEAFEKFCIALKADKEVTELMGAGGSTPIDFKLLDDQGKDITHTTVFANKEKRKTEIEKRINSLGNIAKEIKEDHKKEEIEDFKKVAKIDSAKINELKKYFEIKKDEFSADEKTWYQPKSAPKYTNRNGLYCYFQTENNIPSNLRFRLQYYSDEWLFLARFNSLLMGKHSNLYH